MGSLVDKVKKNISRVISPGEKVVVGVSGGPDSVALLHLLNGLKEEFSFSLILAHLNHMARGKDSDQDADFVACLGEDLDIEAFIESVPVSKKQKELKTSFQETARVVRYEFMERVLKKSGAGKIAVGHTADDQVETVLMNLLRGTGLKGLAGMPSDRGAVIRPLLDCSRFEIEGYLKKNKLAYRKDDSNTEAKYLRNRIRLQLVPELEIYNPRFKSNLIETARILRTTERYLENRVTHLFREMADTDEDGSVLLKHREFHDQDPAIQNRLIRHAILIVKGDLRRVSARHIHEVSSLFSQYRSGKEIHLPGGLKAICRGNYVVFFNKTQSKPPNILMNDGDKVLKLKLNFSGWTQMKSSQVRFHISVVPRESFPTDFIPANRAYLDLDKTGKFIFARFFKPGDRFVPLGMTGNKKLKSFFIDRKIPRDLRKRIPILTTEDGDIIWVYEQRISERYRVTENTKNIILIEGFGKFQEAQIEGK